MKLPLLGGTGADREDDNSQALTRNWYINKTNGKSSAVLYPTPGLTLFADIGTGSIRASIEYGDIYFMVSGNELYEVDASGSGVLRGTLSTSSGRITMAHNGANNGKQILIADGTQGYIWDTTYDTFAIVELKSSGSANVNSATELVDTTTDFSSEGVVLGMVVYNTTDGTQAIVDTISTTTNPNDTIGLVDSDGAAVDTFPLGTEAYEVGEADYPSTATHVAFFDGRFIANDPTNSGRFFASASYQGYDWSSLDFATAERSPDELQALVVSNRQLWLVGTHTSEPWYNSGSADFPYEPIQSGFSQWGTIAPYSLIEIAGMVIWLSQNDEGQGMVIATNGSTPQAISTGEIAVEISKLSKITDAYAWAYQHQQHSFYVLTFPSSEKTFVYDIAMQEWHEWSSKTLGYHRSTTHTFVYGKHLIGDPVTGKVYELDWDNYTDNDDAITRTRRTQSVNGDDKEVIHDGVWIDVKEGCGTVANPSPQLQIRWKDSNGSWSNYHPRSMGSEGDRGIRCIWRNLGRSFDRVYEIQTSEPVNAVLIDAYAKIRANKRDFG